MNVTYAPMQINWTSNYYSQQQPDPSFTTVSNDVVRLCEVRHQYWGVNKKKKARRPNRPETKKAIVNKYRLSASN